jgi:hypothetical protein
MFLDFYHLRVQPFGATPDPRYLYLSRTHREALAPLAARSRGVPRNINNLCFNALSLGYALAAARDLDVEPPGHTRYFPRHDVPPAPAAQPCRARRGAKQSGLAPRPFRTAALVASLALASLFLFPSLRRVLGTDVDRVLAAALSLPESTERDCPRLLPAVSTTPPVSNVAPVDRAVSNAAPTGTPAVIVELKPARTLCRICLERFGRFDRELVQQIRARNPRVTNPNHIEVGQRIVLPGGIRKSAGTYSPNPTGGPLMTSERN